MNTVSSGPQTILAGALTVDVSCPANQRIIGGGFSASSAGVTVFAARIITQGLGGTYAVTADDGILVGQTVTAFAYCAS